MTVWISCAISDSSCLSLHHHLFPRTDQSRLDPALIWEIHIAKAAARWPRGWHCHHLVMTTTAGVAQTHIAVFEDTSVLDRRTFCVCHLIVMSSTLDGKLLVIPGLLCKCAKIWTVESITRKKLQAYYSSSFVFAFHTFKSLNSFSSCFLCYPTDPLLSSSSFLCSSTDLLLECAAADAHTAKIWMDYRI